LSKSLAVLPHFLNSTFSERQDIEKLAVTDRFDKIKFGDVNGVSAIYQSWLLTLCEHGHLNASLLGVRGQQVGAVRYPRAQQD
jgi:hypothetical protein